MELYCKMYDFKQIVFVAIVTPLTCVVIIRLTSQVKFI